MEWAKMENMPSPEDQRKASDEWRRLADMQCEFWRKVNGWDSGRIRRKPKAPE